MANTLIEEAVEFLRLSADASSTNRAEMQHELHFVAGEQWPAELMNSRQLESRPCLTINKLDSFCRQISNQQRQQRPRIKVHPTNDLATKKIADVITGLCRHIEVNSNADNAYDTAFDLAVKVGLGYWRVVTDYAREDTFDQEIYINQVDNPFTVYFDPDSTLPDGADQERCVISDVISKKAFRQMYPGADLGSFGAKGTGDDQGDWVTKEDIRIAEYFRVDKEKSMLVMLNNGMAVYADELPPPEILHMHNLSVVGDRQSYKRVVKWAKVTSMDVLDEKPWPGRWIPIVPVYGNVTILDGKRLLSGIVKNGMDPQRMINYWETAATESIALAPKAKWLMVEGQDEGHENEWAAANLSARPVLHHKATDINGEPAPSPQRLQPEPPPVGILQALQISTGNLREVIGVVDPAMKISGNMSGKALNAEKMQSDNSTFHFYDNLTRSIGHTGKIILDLIPKIYDSQRVSRIIGDDGQPDLVTLNEKDAEGKVLNDLSVGQYDVVMDTGPGYNSKRMEAVDAMAPMMQNQELMKVMGDLYFRNSDFPGAEVIADRLASINPLAQIDEKSDIPPQVQVKMKQQEQMIQQLQGQLQAAELEIKTKAGIEHMKQEGETKRTLMVESGKAHDTMVWADHESRQEKERVETERFEALLRAHSAETVAEIQGHIALLLAKIDERKEAGRESQETNERATQ